ncbi:MAG: DUF3659 domain-containing protein [Promicromonosporaceae bacterium]|nr:DUF3659 domain-containing protein [Promicromonosporaceae bacterium]
MVDDYDSDLYTAYDEGAHYAPVHEGAIYDADAYDEGVEPVAADPKLARHAAEVVAKSEFYRNDAGDLLTAPTNLTVDENGNVLNAAGQIVGRAGEVFVDANGNAVNSAGQIVGSATADVPAIIDTARADGHVHKHGARWRADDAYDDSYDDDVRDRPYYRDDAATRAEDRAAADGDFVDSTYDGAYDDNLRDGDVEITPYGEEVLAEENRGEGVIDA